MTKKYMDIFKKPITADEVRHATIITVRLNKVSSILLQRQMKIGFGKAATIIKLLESAGVVTRQLDFNHRSVILRNEATAVNAALRQLRKGNG